MGSDTMHFAVVGEVSWNRSGRLAKPRYQTFVQCSRDEAPHFTTEPKKVPVTCKSCKMSKAYQKEMCA